MDKKLIILFLVIFLSNCSKTVNVDEVIYHKKLKKIILKNTDNELYTGHILCHDNNGILKYKFKIKNGINISENMEVNFQDVFKIDEKPYEYYYELLYDSTEVLIKDFLIPFNGIINIDTYNDTLPDYLKAKYKLYYKNGILDGLQKSYHESGNTKEEYYCDEGKVNGKYKLFYESGNINIEANFKNDKQNGLYTEYYENEQILKNIEFIDGKIKDGIVKEFFNTGQLKKITEFKKGKINGFEKIYFDNGQLNSIINYVDGNQNGEWKFFDKNGEILDTGEFINGNGTIKEYYSNCQLKLEKHYKDSKLIKDYFEYFENGNTKQKSYYKNGELHGKKLIYYENGNIYEEETYLNGIKNGWSLTYNEDGTIKYDFYYVNGKMEYKEYKKINPEINKMIRFIDIKFEKYNKDYSRDYEPYDAHVRAYFKFKNTSTKKIAAIQFDFTFKDVFGDNLYTSEAKYDINLNPNEENNFNQYWYWEDGYGSPYKKLWSPVESGNIKTEVEITKIVFSDGSILK